MNVYKILIITSSSSMMCGSSHASCIFTPYNFRNWGGSRAILREGPSFAIMPQKVGAYSSWALTQTPVHVYSRDILIPSWSGIVLSATGAVKKKGPARTPAHMAQTIEQYYAHILFSLTEHGRECCEKDHFSLTSNSWHYSCPLSVYCRSIVFLLVV